MVLFTRFLELPAELRTEIWTLAATVPRVIEIRVEGWTVTTYSEPHPLLNVCFESRTICLKHNDDRLKAENSKEQYVVNFARDFFFIRGDYNFPTRAFLPDHLLYQLERVWIQPGPTCYMSNLFSKFPQLQEIWIFLKEKPENFYPSSSSEFRRHCPLHHCDI